MTVASGKFVLDSSTRSEEVRNKAGGKAFNLARLSQGHFPVPEWICLTVDAFESFISHNQLKSGLSLGGESPEELEKSIEELFLSHSIPLTVREELLIELEKNNLLGGFVAVRSSGLEEDSENHSFAGQFSTFLFQRGPDAIFRSVIRCWASAWSARAMAYRKERGIMGTPVKMGVIIQRMIDAEAAGVAFSRNPIDVVDRDNVLISSVWGLGEGLVSGLLAADEYKVHRKNFEVIEQRVSKTKALRCAEGGGLVEAPVASHLIDSSSLSSNEVTSVAKLALDVEKRFSSPQDIEWALRDGKIYLLQARPITTLPPEAIFDEKCVGSDFILWDNSNIVESFSGVTTPLTFSHVSRCYQEVYYQFCRLMMVPEEVIAKNESTFRNMLGLIRGRIYYNLANWYRLLFLFPGTAHSSSFMETMMGVRQGLKPEVAALFDFIRTPVKYSLFARLRLVAIVLLRIFYIRPLIVRFEQRVDTIVAEGRHKNFSRMSLQEQANYYHTLVDKVLKHWQAPIVNDTRCMVFFGLLKSLVSRWIGDQKEYSTLQNDLLCGQGDLESTEPTRMLMRIASEIDNGSESRRSWFLATTSSAAWKEMLEEGVFPELFLRFKEFLDLYGFRCVNELKLEEPDLHDDPSFALEAVASYIRMKSYSIEAMEERERKILHRAEELAEKRLSGLLGFIRKPVFRFVLKHTRSAVRDRENLRFDRTKTFGIVRHLFRGFGRNLHQLGVINTPEDVFYLTIDEIHAFVEGRSCSLALRSLAEIRRAEFETYRKTPAPPDRFTTRGAAGASMAWSQILDSQDLLAKETPVSTDPNVLVGTACCPGIVVGVVRVVKSMQDAQGLNGEILVTERTDPGWVPLYPACSGLLIERGSLLSHSAVVARELGLPTIVGVRGGLVEKLKTGMRISMDAARGEIRILSESAENERVQKLEA